MPASVKGGLLWLHNLEVVEPMFTVTKTGAVAFD
jgi:hypothetical protein